MFGAINFGCFGQDGAAACGHQPVDCCTQRRVRGYRGIAVGCTALQTDGEVGCGDRLAATYVGAAHKAFRNFDACADRRSSPARVLNVQRVPAKAGHVLNLVHFAAKPHQKDAGEIGVRGVSCDGVTQIFNAAAVLRHAASRMVGEGDDAINIGKRGQTFRSEMGRNTARHRR